MLAPSCGEWETMRAGDFEKWLKALSVDASGFADAANGKGGGCKRCPYAEKAHAADSAGRALYCRVWECRVDGKVGCCRVNGAKAKPLPANWDTDMDPDDPWEKKGAKDADDDDTAEGMKSAIDEALKRK